MSDAAVTINHLNKRYGTLHALKDFSLSVARGDFYGLLGPNGAGKTTLINILGGLTRPDSGDGSVLGKDIVADTLAVRQQLGIVPQELLYDPFFNVYEALVFQSKYYGIHDNGVWIDTLLDKLHLHDKVKVNTRALSGGMKRRLMIAQALVHKPQVIVLDEPTAGVDINLRLSLWHFIQELQRDGHTIILTTHYLEEAEALCDKVTLMSGGEVVARGNTRELLSAARHCAHLRIRVSGGERATVPSPDSSDGDNYLYNIEDYYEIEPILAGFRQSGAVLEEVTVNPPKLEDLFIRLMPHQK